MNGISPIFLVTVNSKIWVKNIRNKNIRHNNGVSGEYFDLSYYIVKLSQKETMQNLFKSEFSSLRIGQAFLPIANNVIVLVLFHMLSLGMVDS